MAMAATDKWLIILVDGHSAMGPFWKTIVSEYLEKIIRYVCSKWKGQEAQNRATFELGLIMYNSHFDMGCRVQCSHWTRDADLFMEMLSALTFNAGGLNQSAMAEGLAEALVMFPKPYVEILSQDYFSRERHCILLTASNPFPLKTPLYLPKLLDGHKICGMQADCFMADYRTVTQLFTPLAVSLSVISPDQLPLLREIFNMGNNIPEAAAVAPVFNSGNGRFTVLLSEKFKEAYAALYPQEIVGTSSQPSAEPKKTDIFTLPSDSEDVTCDLSEEDILLLRQLWDNEPTAACQQNIPAEKFPAEASEACQRLVEQEKIATTMFPSDSDITFDVPAKDELDLSWIFDELLNEPTTSQPKDFAEKFAAEVAQAARLEFNSVTSTETQNVVQAARLEFNSVTSTEPQKVVPQNQHATLSVVSSGSLPGLHLRLSGYDDIMDQLNADSANVLPQNTLENCRLKSRDSVLVNHLYKPIPPMRPSNDLGGQVPQEAFLATQAEYEALFSGNAPQNFAPISQTSFGYPTLANASEAVNISPPAAAGTGKGSSRPLLELGGKYPLSLQKKPYDSSCNCAASPFFFQDSITPQPTGSKAGFSAPLGIGGAMKAASGSQGINARNAQHPAGFAFGSKAPNNAFNNFKTQPSLLSRQKSPIVSNEPAKAPRRSNSGPRMEQNFLRWKRSLMSSLNSKVTTPSVGASTLVPMVTERTPLGLIELPQGPIENQLDYVKSWEGAISATYRSHVIFLSRAKVYTKATAPQRVTARWPVWLQVNRVVAESFLNRLSSPSAPAGCVLFQMLRHNSNTKLCDVLRSNRFCIRIRLPSQTLILVPTSDPMIYHGTVYHGEIEFRRRGREQPEQPQQNGEGEATGEGDAAGSK